MKRYDLPSTLENIKETFIEDRINRNEDLVSFVNLINSVEGCYSIALDSQWGSGKTFFVKQLKMIFDSTNAFIDSDKSDSKVIDKWNNLVEQFKHEYTTIATIIPHVTVYYDAWANDSDEDPLLSLVYQIMYDFNELDKSSDGSSISNGLFTALSEIIKSRMKKPVDIKMIKDSFKSEDFLAQLKSKKDLHKLIADYLDNLLPERGERLLIIIDELDRCNPVFAIKLLEQVKHYFENERITFLFSVNLLELEHTICKHYGSSFNAGKYLDRFFDWRITLPKAVIPEVRHFITQRPLPYTISYMIKKYNMQMREVGKYIPMVKDVCYEYETDEETPVDTFRFVFQVFIPLALALKLTNPKKYYDFINGNDPSELIGFVTNESVMHYVRHNIFVILDGAETQKADGTDILTKAIVEENVKRFYEEFFNINDSRGTFGIGSSVREFFFNKINQIRNSEL